MSTPSWIKDRVMCSMSMAGTAESWAGYGYGYGYGYGSGDGSGYGDGDGYGDGSGDGYGYGYGSGDGYGYGSGYGSGSGSGDADVVVSDLPERHITVDQLRAADACDEGVDEFEDAFPDGATYPTDIAKAQELGLDVGWISHLGLFVPEESTSDD